MSGIFYLRLCEPYMQFVHGLMYAAALWTARIDSKWQLYLARFL